MNLQDLKKKTPAELLSYAEELEIENASTLRKQDMMFAILKQLAEDDVPIYGGGVLEDVIGRYDIEWRSQEIATHLVGYLNDERSIIGKEARKHLRPGSPLRASDLISPQIIDRGQTVDLVARSSGLVVNMQGTALANGAEGDRLLVKNLSSGKKGEGLVRAGGTVLSQ